MRRWAYCLFPSIVKSVADFQCNMERVEHLLHITHDCYLPGARPLLGYLEGLVQSANVHLMMYTETLLIKSNRMVTNITYSLITYLYCWDLSRISSCDHVLLESHVMWYWGIWVLILIALCCLAELVSVLLKAVASHKIHLTFIMSAGVIISFT